MKHEAQAETVRRVEGDPDHKSGQPEHGPICPDHCLGCQSYGGGYFAESVRNASDIERAIISAGRKPGGALIVFPDSLPVAHNALIIRLAEQRRLPAVYPFRVFAANGGLMSYGLDLAEIYRQAAIYVDEISEVANPPNCSLRRQTNLNW